MSYVYDAIKESGIPVNIPALDVHNFEESQIPIFFKNLKKVISTIEADLIEKDKEIGII